MRKSSTVASVIALVVISTALPARAEKHERPSITLSRKGNDLEIVVHNVADYCVTNAATQIVRTGESIRILRDRPSKSSSCVDTRDLVFVAPDVGAGRYTITYERLPLLAPIRWIRVASTTAVIE